LVAAFGLTGCGDDSGDAGQGVPAKTGYVPLESIPGADKVSTNMPKTTGTRPKKAPAEASPPAEK
jgi:hypothetical protein